jgi:hypothetical protein
MFGVELVASILLAGALPRAEADRPDEVRGPQTHAVYAVPRDGEDRSLDTNGTVASSVAAFQTWLAAEAGGANLRLDVFRGELDVTFVRLQRSDAELAARGAFVRDEIEAELTRRGLVVSSKVYAVYYDGSSTWSCGGGAWPPRLPGRVAAMYLRGEPPGAPACATNRFAGPGDPPGYFEFGMLHELLHTLGFAAECATHHHLAGHVRDNPNDLMWAGDAPWQLPPRLDIGRDDYYGHGRSDCPDLATSPYLSSNPPPPPVASAIAYSVGRARAGRRMSVRLAIEVDGVAPSQGSTRCSARLGAKPIRARASFAFGRGVCTWTLPRTAAGKRLRGRIQVTTPDASVRRTFSVPVRR